MTNPEWNSTLDYARDTMERVRPSLCESLSEWDLIGTLAKLCRTGSLGDIWLRSTLFRLGLEAYDGELSELVAAAAGIELLQLSTLVIDDILDRSDTRFGAPALWRSHGDQQALVTASALSFAGLQSFSDAAACKGERGVRALSVLSSSLADLYRGQSVDLSAEGGEGFTEADYFHMIGLTTGAFAGAAFACGAVLGGANSGGVDTVSQIGRELGVALQVRDDIIDFLGAEEATGKPSGGDRDRSKQRLPMIRARKRGISVEEIESKGRAVLVDCAQEVAGCASRISEAAVQLRPPVRDHVRHLAEILAYFPDLAHS